MSELFFINQVIWALRLHFQQKNLLPFFSPALVKSAGMEPYLDGFEVQGNFASYYLPTSPEFSLKKAFALFPHDNAGIYDIAHAFRDEHVSPLHRHEFTMVEWYNRDCHYQKIISQVISVLQIILQSGKRFSLSSSLDFLLSAPEVKLYAPDEKQNWQNEYNSEKIKIFSVAQLFEKFLNFTLTPYTELQELKTLASRHNIYFHPQNDDENNLWIELYSLIMDELIEPHLKPSANLVFVKDYPPLTRAMAELNAQGWAARIECYVEGKEIANGYQELCDPEELKKIWHENNKLRLRQNKKIHPLDMDLLELTPFMQNACGTALGLERTLLALYPQFSLPNFFL